MPAPPPRRVRSLAISLVIILLFGAAANVAVTWRLAASSAWQNSEPALGRAWTIEGGYLKLFWFRRTGAEDVMAVLQTHPPEPDLFVDPAPPPAWFPLDEARRQSARAHEVQPPARARGWPLLSFWDEGAFDAEAIAQFERPMPLRPIWRGALINTLFYSGIGAIAFISARVIRRALRKSHGDGREPSSSP